MTISKEKTKELINEFGKNAEDSGTTESQISIFSERIKNLTEHLKINKKDKSAQRGLMLLVSKRSRLLKYLKNVVKNGTAQNLNLNGYNIGGKTGTAQKFIENSYSKNEFVSSFASVFPIENPKYVLLVSIDSPQYGYHWANQSAVPVTKEIIKRIIIFNSIHNLVLEPG